MSVELRELCLGFASSFPSARASSIHEFVLCLIDHKEHCQETGPSHEKYFPPLGRRRQSGYRCAIINPIFTTRFMATEIKNAINQKTRLPDHALPLRLKRKCTSRVDQLRPHVLHCPFVWTFVFAFCSTVITT